MCAEILKESHQLSNQQMRTELMAAYNTDAADARGKILPADGEGEEISRPMVLTMMELQMFWKSVGLTEFQAEKLSKELVRTASPYSDIGLLEAKMERLRRTLPDVDVPQMVRNGPDILEADIQQLVMRVMELYATMEDAAETNIPAMVQFCPKVLIVPDLMARFDHTVRSIQFLFPRLPLPWIKAAIADEPELLFEMPKYEVIAVGGMDIAELPVTVQNMLSWAARQKWTS
eukprot:CAMPEP_0198211862 /NCGR_PEP_ID=MMETSP1445-20131203/25388_1 /TAXON_ID=36898 /ORGANISM="Pyramimonas sp., Strain CCMP2087" /LENGTH=231 /DNA_ID=CAMNT_0043886211 /DNA_START=433 /DNA_END=1128 /DNA_ORIENTATION=+